MSGFQFIGIFFNSEVSFEVAYPYSFVCITLFQIGFDIYLEQVLPGLKSWEISIGMLTFFS